MPRTSRYTPRRQVVLIVAGVSRTR